MSEGDTLSNARLIVATDLDGDPRDARIRQAVEFSLQELHDTFPDQIKWHESCVWSRRDGRVEARQQEKFGALVLDNRIWRNAPADLIAQAMLEGVRQLGLSLSPAASRLIARAELMHAGTPAFPDLSKEHLMATLKEWLLPHLSGVKTAADWREFDILPALKALLGWKDMQNLVMPFLPISKRLWAGKFQSSMTKTNLALRCVCRNFSVWPNIQP